VSPEAYQLYVEVPSAPITPDTTPPSGWIARQIQRFKVTLAEAEEERLRRERGEPAAATGLWRTFLGRIAEAIAEQRLLWYLRNQTRVTLQHPDLMTGEAAIAELRREFAKDAGRHRRWMLIDGLVTLITGPLFFFVPGPNVVSWYFTFRTIAHFLSWRGARKGLTAIVWDARPCGPLEAIRPALTLPPLDRRHRLDELSASLGLKHLTGFVERTANAAEVARQKRR
jgi:hypothetical protein